MGDFSTEFKVISSLTQRNFNTKLQPCSVPIQMQHNQTGNIVPLRVQGLLARITPTCRGYLKRRTRYTRVWKSESDLFEIRSNMLVLYKRRSSTNGSNSIGLLDTIFSRATIADLDRSSVASSVGTSVQSEIHDDTLGNGTWTCVFDLTGARVCLLKSEEANKCFSFKIIFAGKGGDSNHGSLNLCAVSNESRSLWVRSIEIASRGVKRENFELLKTIGRGQWGKVFLARKNSGVSAIKKAPLSDFQNMELLAVKEVALSSKTNISHVQNERLIMEAVPQHEFLVNMQYAFRSGRFLYYALDFMDGGDLFRHWRKYRDQRNEMTPFYSAEVLLALEHLHKYNVVYRDLKPENILIDHAGHVKLADLGLAKMLHDKNGRTTSFCGTEAYLAPEMILRVPYSFSVDFWQYGCFLFELYAGRSPFWLPRKPRKVIRDNILNGNFAFPASVPEKAKPLIVALLNINENERLGSVPEYDSWISVKEHSFFNETKWDAVIRKQIPPPIIPEDPGPSFCNNFDDDFIVQFPKWGEHPDGIVDDTVNAFEEELLGFSFVRVEKMVDVSL